MAKITDLPIELLEYIFDDTASTFSPEWYRNLPAPSRALFPFNVASTCTLWLSILKSKSKYWRQVVIDIADDPTPFLDTLSLFKTDGDDTARIIVVFSSMSNSASQHSSHYDESVWEDAKDIENTRARAVFERLEESVPDCGSITFDLVYQSSLPSSARLCTHELPLLHQLSLTCAIYDCDEVAGNRSQGQYDSLHQLSPLSIAMTGANFVELYNWGPHSKYLLYDLLCLDLSINHFVFNSIKQVRSFQNALANIYSFATLSLSDLTLTCSASMRPNSEFDWDTFIDIGHLVFDSASPNFLKEFMPAIFRNEEVQFLTFRQCTIPCINFGVIGKPDLSATLQLLQLIDIPYREDNNSLFNAIHTLTPDYLRLLRCEGVTDELLKDLATAECCGIHTLQLHNCSGFTSRGVRAFILAREEINRDRKIVALRALEVYGTGPLLSADDAAFFLGDMADSSTTRVEWNVVGHDNIPDGYMTDLRSADEVESVFSKDSLWYCPLAQVSKDAMYTLDQERYTSAVAHR